MPQSSSRAIVVQLPLLFQSDFKCGLSRQFSFHRRWLALRGFTVHVVTDYSRKKQVTKEWVSRHVEATGICEGSCSVYKTAMVWYRPQIIACRSPNIFSSAWLWQQSSWNRNLSVVRPSSVSQLSLNLMHGFLSYFGCCFPWAIRQGIFLRFEIFFKNFLWILISHFVNMGPCGIENSKHYSSYKSQPKVFKLFLNFFLMVLKKVLFWIFEILSFRFLTIFFRKFQFYHCSLLRNQKPQLSGKRAIVEQNRV